MTGGWLSRLLDSRDASVAAHIVLAVVTISVGLGLLVWSVVVLKQQFQFQGYCTGVGVLLAGLGVASKWGGGAA